MGWVFIAIGLFSLGCSILDVGWFFEHRKASALVGLIGRTGARVLYAALGLALLALGIGGVTGLVSLSR